MARMQSLVQWDSRRDEDQEVLADLCTHPPKERGRRLRQLALKGLRAERGGIAFIDETPRAVNEGARVEGSADQVDPMDDDFFGGMLDNLEDS